MICFANYCCLREMSVVELYTMTFCLTTLTNSFINSLTLGEIFDILKFDKYFVNNIIANTEVLVFAILMHLIFICIITQYRISCRM